MKTKITITSEEGEVQDVMADQYLLILSNPDNFEGVSFKSNVGESVPRMIGLVEWMREYLSWCAQYNFNKDFYDKKKKKNEVQNKKIRKEN